MKEREPSQNSGARRRHGTLTRLGATAGAAAAVVTVTVPGCGGSSSNAASQFTVPSGQVLRPFVTAEFPGDSHATSNQNTWTEGVQVTSPNGHAVVVTFKSPSNSTWEKVSVVSASVSHEIVLQIGNSAVEFGATELVKAGTADAHTPPDITFSPEEPLTQLSGIYARGWEESASPLNS